MIDPMTILPERLVVIGRAIDCELAQAFARFGSRVTMIANVLLSRWLKWQRE